MKNKNKIIGLLLLTVALTGCKKEQPCPITQTEESKLIEFNFTCQHDSAEKSVTFNSDTLTTNIVNALPGDTIVFRANQFPSGTIALTVREDGKQIAGVHTSGTNLYKMLIIE